MHRIGWTAGLALFAAVVLMPAVARAQYQAPPPDPGFHYIFDGTADRLGRLVRQVEVRRAAPPRSRAGSRAAGPGDARRGRGLVPRRRVAVRLLLVPGRGRSATWCSASSTRSRTRRRRRRNGGIMIRTPEVALHRRRHQRRPRPEADRLQLRRLPGRAGVLQPHDAGRVDDLQLGRAPGPFPPAPRPAVRVLGRLLRAQRHAQRHQPRRQPAAADGQRQRQQPPALDAGLLRP